MPCPVPLLGALPLAEAVPDVMPGCARAAPGGAGRSAEDGELPSVAREVLRQLALGTKDETAAREMGMALRTYRRVVAQLMENLDARSRFQAGFLAGQRGLLQ
ncbi:hypothetical protein [Streptomyces sp. NPDC002587]